jgi:hypothetical protein
MNANNVGLQAALAESRQTEALRSFMNEGRRINRTQKATARPHFVQSYVEKKSWMDLGFPKQRELVLKMAELEDIAYAIRRSERYRDERNNDWATMALNMNREILQILRDDPENEMTNVEKANIIDELLVRAESLLEEGRTFHRDGLFRLLPMLLPIHQGLLEQEEEGNAARQAWEKGQANHNRNVEAKRVLNEAKATANAAAAAAAEAEAFRSPEAVEKRRLNQLKAIRERGQMPSNATTSAAAPAPAPAAPAPVAPAPTTLTAANLARRAEAAKRAAATKARLATPATNGAAAMPPNGASKPTNKKNNTKGGSKNRRTSKTQRNKKAYF